MKAYIINRYSKEEPLVLTELDTPLLNDYDILVRVLATSINPLDIKIKNGDFKHLLPHKLPLILGHDVAGVIEKIGTKVTKFKIGDEVFARPNDNRIGTFAEFIAINEKDAAKKPNNISMQQAASIPLVGLTAWQALIKNGQLQKGQKVFIQAGAGGVGSFAIQLAKHLGAFVATTASKSNFDLVKSLGADLIIDYKNENFETVLKDYDLVLNSQDIKTLEKSLSILKSGGKIISISGPPDSKFAKEFKLSWLLKLAIYFLSKKIRKKANLLKIDYSFLFMQANGEELANICSLIESNIIKPVIDKVYNFEQLNEALSYVASGRAKGKVVINI